MEATSDAASHGVSERGETGNEAVSEITDSGLY